ncbi:MAG: class I adenylate-forming enzyme family protein, partial [Dehalococcoidia bacterium]|nr:class I adenylate-forming enzyme family protein [Dehalococcoidia bacterium]
MEAEATNMGTGYYYPPRMNAAYFLVDDNANRKGNDIAIYCGREAITYGQLRELVNRLGNGLKELGVVPGDRVLCRFPNQPEGFISVLGAMKAGAIPVPILPFLREREVQYIINHTEAVAALTASQAVAEIHGVRQECPTLRHVVVAGAEINGCIQWQDLLAGSSPDLEAADTGREDTAYLVYTSGTTGLPKGIAHRHDSILLNSDSFFPFVFGERRPDDVLFSPAPMGLAFGLASSCFLPLRFGVPVVLVPERLSPEDVFDILEKHRVTLLLTAAPILEAMLDVPEAEKQHDLRALRCVATGASLATVPLCRGWQERFGIGILPAYGLSETVGAALASPQGQGKPATLGKGIPGWEYRVANEDFQEVPQGEMGVLLVRGSVVSHYWRAPELSESSFHEGWFITGDVVSQDSEGYFHLAGRIDEIIKSSGWTISPVEVEEAIATHPSVLEAAVVGLPHPVKGQEVAAAVVLKPVYTPSGKLEEEIAAHVAG